MNPVPTPHHDPRRPAAAPDGAPPARVQIALAAATVVGVVYPFALAYHALGIEIAFKSFAADAFYYLAIADNSRDAAFYTFDGRYPTNGFHPLWAYLLSALFSIMPQSPDAQMRLAYFLSVVLVAAGAGLFALALLRLSRWPALSLLAAVPGFHYLLLATVDGHYGATWSFANGMESPLSIALFGVFAHRLLVANDLGRDALRGVATLATLASALVLARLDDVFLLAPLIGVVALTAPTRRALVARTLVAAAIPAAAIGAYLLYNHASTGLMMPTSGTAKLSADGLRRNLAALADAFLPLRDRDWAWSGATWRVLNMVLPAVVALAWLAWVLVRREARHLPAFRQLPRRGEQLVAVLAIYVVLKAGHNFLNVALWNQGHWYYPLGIMTANLLLLLVFASWRQSVAGGAPVDSGIVSPRTAALPAAARWILVGGAALAALAALALLAHTSDGAPYFNRWGPRRLALALALLALALALLAATSARVRNAAVRFGARLRRLAWEHAATAAVAAYVLLLANGFATLKIVDPRGAEFYRFWAARHEIDAALRQAGFASPVVECDDGIVSYSLPSSAMSGFALALDREAFEYTRQLELFDIAWRRGARLIGSVWYVREWPDAAASDEETLRRMVGDLCWGQSVERWKFRVVLQRREPGFHFVFIAFEPA